MSDQNPRWVKNEDGSYKLVVVDDRYPLNCPKCGGKVMVHFSTVGVAIFQVAADGKLEYDKDVDNEVVGDDTPRIICLSDRPQRDELDCGFEWCAEDDGEVEFIRSNPQS